MGRELAVLLGVGVGDRVLFHGPGNLREVMNELKKAEAKDSHAKSLGEIRQLIQPAELEVTGLFETGRFQYDAEFALVPLHVAQEIYGLRGDIHGLTVRTRDPYWAETFKPELRAQLGPEFVITSWIDQNKQLFDAIQIERGTMFVILLLIVGVAAFAIMNTLITVTVQKRREIGIQKALGARPVQVMWVFLAQGGVVGFLGIATGVALGFTLLAWRNEFRDALSRALGIEIFPKGVYQFSQIPAEVVTRDVVFICSAAFLASVIAAAIPALFAAWTDPVKALREE
jgi:lipoprotein-releasing system permease protein